MVAFIRSCGGLWTVADVMLCFAMSHSHVHKTTTLQEKGGRKALEQLDRFNEGLTFGKTSFGFSLRIYE